MQLFGSLRVAVADRPATARHKRASSLGSSCSRQMDGRLTSTARQLGRGNVVQPATVTPNLGGRDGRISPAGKPEPSGEVEPPAGHEEFCHVSS
jgi:hypothetical protein